MPSFETLGPGYSLGVVLCQPGPPEFQNRGRKEVFPAHRATHEQSGQAGLVASERRECCKVGPWVSAQGGPMSSCPGLGSPHRCASAAVVPFCPSLTQCSLFQPEPQLHRSDRVSLHVAVLLPAYLLWRDADGRQHHRPQRHGRHGTDCR